MGAVEHFKYVFMYFYKFIFKIMLLYFVLYWSIKGKRKGKKSGFFLCPFLFIKWDFAKSHLGLVFAKRQCEVSMQKSILLHEHHTVFIWVALSAGYQAARGSGNNRNGIRGFEKSIPPTETALPWQPPWKKKKYEVRKWLLLPAQCLLQPIDGLTSGLQDTLSVPHPHFPGPSLRTNGTDSKKLTIPSPRHSRPAVVPPSCCLHFLCLVFNRKYLINI